MTTSLYNVSIKTNESNNVSICIRDIFNTPKDVFEQYAMPFFQLCGQISRIDYAVNRRDDGKSRVMAFIHFSEIDDNSQTLRTMLDDFKAKEYSDIYIMPNGRYFRTRLNKTPIINETTLNFQQVANYVLDNSENIKDHQRQFKDHKKQIDNLVTIFGDFILDTKNTMTNNTEDIILLKQKYRCIHDEFDLYNQIYALEDKATKQQQCIDSLNGFLERIMENAEKQEMRIQLLEQQLKSK